MELWAVVAGLHALKQPSRITLHTTSRYVMDGATLWLASWESGGWLTRDGEPVKNRELWMELSRAMGDHDLTWVALSSRNRNEHSSRAAELARTAAEAVKS
jgi:ribonuclease HI